MPEIEEVKDNDPDTVIDNDPYDKDEREMDPFGGKTFNELLQQAANIKSDIMKKERRVFESRPDFLKRTLTHHSLKELGPLREGDAASRISYSETFKKEGNEAYKSADFKKARDKYERGISVLLYVVNVNPEWKKKGMYDKDLKIKDLETELSKNDVTLRKKVRELKISLLINLGIVLIKTCRWTLARQALDYVLTNLDQDSVKALYHKARVLSLPPSSGATEFEMAIECLTHANRVDPSNTSVSKMLKRMRRDMKNQRESDRKTFAGLFERGSIVHNDTTTTKREEEEKSPSSNRDVKELENIARSLEREGKKEMADELREHIERAKEKHRMKRFQQVDFSSPTEKMIEDAKKMGLDLNDVQVREALVEMQRRQLKGESISDITKDMTSSASTPAAVQAGKPNSYFHIILPVMLAVFLYRMYSLGLLSWLAGYITGSHADADEADEDDFFGDW
jgi:tetratricopeptide (TPR) repeat protein